MLKFCSRFPKSPCIKMLRPLNCAVARPINPSIKEMVCVSETYSSSSPSLNSTGCLSRLSYHWITLPIKKAQLPQNVLHDA